MPEADAYRLANGVVIYKGSGGRWYRHDTHTPLAITPSSDALEGATPLYLVEGLA